ncbi:carboxypeptidase-like regulatory domain-containing protein [Mucilaginibacter myungsuensis]|uniref:Carboxypeptidase-like regulatory domain-containing protein n=1 Tax=Mucilaginibacter myungsuensis TaxID=649104 RepID=A0A929L0G9_9SPHI|nr:carboxypeptidase-like regulatory domain-containing protein [Mucilaginibacter myungsuensis]MBE9663323.1 carboxypeptidase-like regulatory domain-containing protein [Mucilaginibacter myungsuensis]MDN3600058.1 carboxypeptidase-like regulatory domain-containing protein [Mucilaginibacter myungsuensis]
MKLLVKYLFFFLFITLGTRTFAQGSFAISGTVADEKGVTLPGATVFLSGTKKMTATSTEGKFNIGQLAPGTYEVSVSMVGFEPYAQTVVVKASSVIANVVMRVKTNQLNEVTIRVTDPTERRTHLALFRNAFLGTTENGRSCTIINPDVLSFTFDKKEAILRAEASDIVLVENKNLGYRIKYLLKYFAYDMRANRILYHGEPSFEDLDGNEKDKKRWAEHRAETYKYSMMHFLRSVYAGNSVAEGFVVYVVNSTHPDLTGRVVIDAEPESSDPSKFVTVLDTSFVSFKFNKLYIMHAPSKAAKKDAALSLRNHMLDYNNKGTIIELMATEAVIDRRGSYANFKTFFIQGGIADKQVGDRLPFEYQP